MEEAQLLHHVINIVVSYFLIASVCTAGFPAFASNYQVLVDESTHRSEEQKSQYQALVKENERRVQKHEIQNKATVNKAETAFKEHAKALKRELKSEEGGLADQIIQNVNNLDKQKSENKTQGLIIFVSFSMPKELLWSYFEQAKLYGGRLVIRGLVDNSFKNTIAAMDLGNDRRLIVDVNPKLFKEYKITRVPSIIISDAKNVDKFTGTVTVKYALEEVSTKGDTKDLAVKKLSQTTDFLLDEMEKQRINKTLENNNNNSKVK